MNWNLEGLQVFGNYMDQFPVSGRVTLSRVTYGGEVNHHINLDSSIEVYGAIRDSVILNMKDIIRVCDINNE